LDVGDKLLTVYTPNQSYLLIMDFQMKQLKRAGILTDHPRFIIKTTASAMSWDEWAKANNIPVINLPVGFKEIASMMKKVEKQLTEHLSGVVAVHDIFGDMINLGVQPRLLFAGEESGGMITGPEEPIKSSGGRKAIAMREKSAGEAIVIASAMIGNLEKNGIYVSDYLEQVFEENKIKGKFDIRVENIFYNESNPDPISMKKEKEAGEILRDKNDNFFLGIALARRENKITVNQAKQILGEAMPGLGFESLEDVEFVGDGTYLRFKDKYVEIRKSGTDAKTKAYGAGNDKEECIRFAKEFAFYGGELTRTYKQLIGESYLKDVQKRGKEIYLDFLRKEAPSG
jgi:phosphomannomutase